MLGTAGWQRHDWETSYYPPDLPPDWRLAYYANDADCVLLTADDWLRPSSEFIEALEEAPAELVLFLLPSDNTDALAVRAPQQFAGRRSVLLLERPLPRLAGSPQWNARGADRWVDSTSGEGLVRWWLESADLRRLRAQAEMLPVKTVALVLDGPAASPALLPDLRMLLVLLGRG